MLPPVAHIPDDHVPLQPLIDRAIELYGVRILDNIDLSVLEDPAARARVVANALMERGDARAFVMGRDLLDACQV